MMNRDSSGVPDTVKCRFPGLAKKMPKNRYNGIPGKNPYTNYTDINGKEYSHTVGNPIDEQVLNFRTVCHEY